MPNIKITMEIIDIIGVISNVILNSTKNILKSIVFLMNRNIIILQPDYLVKFLIIDKLITNDTFFNYAYFNFLILQLKFSLLNTT